jgi:hypothetical protein
MIISELEEELMQMKTIEDIKESGKHFDLHTRKPADLDGDA